MTKTRQEIFNTAYRGLASQNFEKSRGDSGCAYRGAMGRRCAIGWCISDHDYSPNFESWAASMSSILEAADVSPADAGFARGLQEAHDLAGDAEDMKDRLRTFAHANGLTIPEVTDRSA